MHLELCIVCGAGPKNLSTLYKHLRKHHEWSEERIEQEKLRLKTAKNKNLVLCDECNNVYSSKRSLGIHKQRFHAKESNRMLSVVCPECGERFYSQTELVNHCGVSHRSQNPNSDFSILRGSFSSSELFEAWKLSLETTAYTFFAKRRSKDYKNGKKHLYVCKYARGHAEVDARGIRHYNSKSLRVQSHCPAFLKITEQADGSVDYECCIGHLGHDVRPANLRISTEDKMDVMDLLKMDTKTFF
ncbi:zinc finger, C2H2 type, partial [Cooperia oncophora]